MTTTTQTIEELIKSLITLKLDLIPIKAGAKLPIESSWNVPSPRQNRAVIARFAAASGVRVADMKTTTAADFTHDCANIGVLNETSGIITLDCDSPQAGAALQAAADALGGDVANLYAGASWTSAKGMKVMFRRPAKATASRAVFKVWNGTSNDVIFELRGTGQDVLPPSWREDAQMRLAWIDGLPAKIPAMPPWLAVLYGQMLAGSGDALNAMYDALGVDPAVRNRSRAHSLDAYPAYCAGFPSERGWVNANYSVEELLAQYGYVKVGPRWRPAEATTSAGIIPPRRGRAENWLCEHEGDPLAGVFDAFRLLVELEFDGDPITCAASIRAEQRRQLVQKQPDQNADRAQRGQGDKQDLPQRDHSAKRHEVASEPAREPEPGSEADDQPDDGSDENHSNPQGTASDQGKDGPPDNQIDNPREQGPEIHPQSSVATAKFGSAATVAEKKPRAKSKVDPEDRAGRTPGWLRHHVDPIKPIIKGTLELPPGAHILSGMPKCGKSTLASAIAMTAASGYGVSGFQVDAPVSVLYLALDESVDQDLQPRLFAYATGKHLDEQRVEKNLDIVEEPGSLLSWANRNNIDTGAPLPFEWTGEGDDALTDDQLEAHTAIIRAGYNDITRALYHYIKRKKIGVCVVDVVTRLRMEAKKFAPVYDRDMRDFLALNEIGTKTGCAIIGLHHMNKDAASRNASNDVHSLAKVSGSNAIAGAVQSIISMSRLVHRGVDQETIFETEPKGRKIVLDHISRSGTGFDPVVYSLVATDVGTHKPMLEWTHAGTIDDMLSSDERSFILDWLYEQPADQTFNATALHTAATNAGVTNSRRESFRQILNKMRRLGLLESTRGTNGGFRLSTAKRTAMKTVADARKF